MSLGSRHLRLLGGAVVVLTFVAGGLGGAAVERLLRGGEAEVREVGSRRADDCDRFSGNNQRQRGRSMYDELGLSPEQSRTLDAVLERQRARMDSVWQGTRPRMDSIVDQARADIRSVLTDAQKAELDRRRRERMVRDSVRREEWRRRCAEQSKQRAASEAAQPSRSR